MKKENKKKVIIRLYRQFDIDLIYAFQKLKESKIVLQDWIVDILRSFANGSYVPGFKSEENTIVTECTGNNRLTLPRKQQFHIILDDVDDADIISWLDTITIGYRNTVIKGVIRGHIGKPCIYPCLTSTDLYFKGTDYEPAVKLVNDGIKQ